MPPNNKNETSDSENETQSQEFSTPRVFCNGAKNENNPAPQFVHTHRDNSDPKFTLKLANFKLHETIATTRKNSMLDKIYVVSRMFVQRFKRDFCPSHT